MMIIWIEKPPAMAIHERQLAEHGGGNGVCDETLLDSALDRPPPRHAYGDPPPDLANLAASLAFGLARNHPFVDGNKRPAAVACESFVSLHDGVLHAEDLERYPVYIALAEGSLPEGECAVWLRQHIKLEVRKRVNEPRSRRAR